MWELYDELIESVPDDLTVLSADVGLHWTAVRSELGMGLAVTTRREKECSGLPELRGTSLRELASCLKEDNLLRATLGLAAVNAALNNHLNILQISVNADESRDGEPEAPGRSIEYDDSNPLETNAFRIFEPACIGRRVAAIGHFGRVGRLSRVCDFSLLESISPADFRWPEIEQALPRQEVIFVSAASLIHKTLPRILSLCGQAGVVIVGPSTPLSPVLFRHGAAALAGLIVEDPEQALTVVRQCSDLSLTAHGGRTACLML